ncbi:SGNH/GDSL hydrolase family protein [Paenarthrobacter nitroguajacolicus]|uniref:SGNH/GDSL hydrolase family protein n=1 Tax=Paenarthrobacter nitroguajacolicus TaxID=211146 RepID=UPI004054046C
MKVAVIGDSYASGSGAASQSQGWVQQMARNQAWQLENFARGGTGYVAGTKDPVKAKDACNREACPTYGEMISSAKTFAPEVVIVSGGRNDYGVDPETEDSAIRAFYTTLRQELPNAKIVAFSPLWDDDSAPATIPVIASVVQESVTAVGGIYLDSGQPLQGRPDLLASDSKHPNDLGYKVLFEKNLSLLQQAEIAVK